MRIQRLIDSVNNAVNGILTTLRRENNMRIHYVFALGVISVSLFMNFTIVEFLIMLSAITFVVMAEMFNTAIERVVDIVAPDYNKKAGAVKDIAAGAVFIAAFYALVVGYLLFFNRIMPLANSVMIRVKNAPIHLTFVAILITLILTVGFKMMYHKGSGGTHFFGGAVSGHSALSFALATAIANISTNILVAAIAFALAVLVAESRIEGKIHSVGETIWGAVLGFLVTLICFQAFN